MAAFTRTFVQESQPSGIAQGDIWYAPGVKVLKICCGTDPSPSFCVVPIYAGAQPVAAVAGSIVAGGTGAAAGGWDTAPHRDTSITTMTEVITQLNAVITTLKNLGVVV